MTVITLWAAMSTNRNFKQFYKTEKINGSLNGVCEYNQL